MRGLIYKDVLIFFKSLDKKMLLFGAGMTVFAMFAAGDLGGLLASFMLSLFSGIQSILCIVSDEKANWKKYQRAMPVNGFSVVMSKYLSVLCTASAVSILGGLVFNLIASVLYQSFDPAIWLCSLALAAFFPLLWNALCLPLSYWFGFQGAQSMGILMVIPIFLTVKHFEDGPGLALLVNMLNSYVLAAILLVIVLLGISFALSVAGYRHRK